MIVMKIKNVEAIVVYSPEPSIASAPSSLIVSINNFFQYESNRKIGNEQKWVETSIFLDA